MTLKISISGIRGTVPDSLTPEVCLDFAKAFGSYIAAKHKAAAPPPKIVVGTDPRASSEFIKGIVFSGLLSTGCNVIDLGICPTPTVGIMTRELKAQGGIIITASHNPLPYNGIKFVRADGIFLNQNQAQRLIELYEKKEFIKGKPGKLTSSNAAIDKHIKKILKNINATIIRKKKIKVAVDSCNGAGSEIALRLLKKLGCEIEAINCDLSRPFPRPPEPLAENLKELAALVKAKKADIGFAFDSDADRLAIVSETGQPIGEENSLVLAVKFIVSKNAGSGVKKKIIITNLSTTKAIDDIVQEYGGTVIRTKIGEVHVAEELKKLNGLIGGEGNGGIIYPRLGYNRDALMGLALILNLMATTNKKVSELVAQLPTYYVVKKKVECSSRNQAEAFIEKAKENFKGRPLILTDGVKVMLPSSWVHIRSSNTEPVIRVIAEGKKPEAAAQLVDQVLKTCV